MAKKIIVVVLNLWLIEDNIRQKSEMYTALLSGCRGYFYMSMVNEASSSLGG